MSILDLFFLFLILATLQPVLGQRMLDASRRRLIALIEERRSSRVILLVHRQETMSVLGFPVMRFIDMCDAEAVIHAVELTDPDVPLDIVVHTPGGLVMAALQIARAIARRPGKVTVFVPHYALSGGTLIALAADEIVLSEHAVLGPVDPQIDGMAAASILSVVERKSVDRVDDRTLMLAHQAQRAQDQMRRSVEELLTKRLDPSKARELAELLTQGTWTHDHPIDVIEARRLGLAVSTDMPREFLQLMTLYPQPTRCASTVEYVNEPRHGGRSGDRPVS